MLLSRTPFAEGLLTQIRAHQHEMRAEAARLRMAHLATVANHQAGARGRARGIRRTLARVVARLHAAAVSLGL